MKTRMIASLLVLLVTMGADQARGQAPAGDLAKLEGRWWTKTTIAGSTRAVTNVIDIAGDHVTTSQPRRAASKTAEPALEAKSIGQIKVNESGSSKTIDFNNTRAPNTQIGDIKLPDAFGIYEIDGDTVNLCVNNGLVNKSRPGKFAANPRAGIALFTWSRSEPADDMPVSRRGRGAAVKTKTAPTPRPAKVEKLEAVPGATVVGTANRTISFKTADGQTFTTGTAIAQAFDAEGNKIARGLDVMVAGNVVDLTLILADKAGHPNQIKEVRLLRGATGHVVLESNAPAAKGKGRVTYLTKPEGPGESYQRAVITSVDLKKGRVTVSVDEKSVEFAMPNAATAAFDLQGNRLRSPAEARLLRIGNKVDVVLKPRSRDPRFAPFVVSIRLVEGELTDGK